MMHRRTLLAAVPALLALIWAAGATPAMAGLAGGLQRPWPDAVLTAVAVALAGLAGAMRWQTAKPVDFATPMLATGAGVTEAAFAVGYASTSAFNAAFQEVMGQTPTAYKAAVARRAG